jgi:hypothetical protein
MSRCPHVGARFSIEGCSGEAIGITDVLAAASFDEST